jgi:chemotaxis signal transduction protein
MQALSQTPPRAGLSWRAMVRRAGTSAAPDAETLGRLLGAWGDGTPASASEEPAAARTAGSAFDGRLLRCDIGGAPYAFPLLAVAEVVPYSPPRRLPGQPADTGVTKVRGRMLPTVDAAARMGVATDAQPGRMVVLATASGEHAVAVTDAHDIVEIDPSLLSAPPGGGAAAGFVLALADIDGEVVVVLDPERLCR